MSYECKSPVLLIFFNRPETFAKVFEKVKKTKPKNLILVQDGPRNQKDEQAVLACRKIAEDIDWDCNVVKDYAKENMGCGMRPQTGISKALELFEEVIVLEDDCVPADSFFQYCDELLEKYKEDERIAYISGLNHFENWKCKDQSYFFTKTGAIHGWATWRRVWSKYYDYHVQGIENSYILNLTKKQFSNKVIAQNRVKNWQRARQSAKNGEKLSYWDNQWGFVKYVQSMLVIVPKNNLISNIGGGAASTHAQSLKNTSFQKYKNFIHIPVHEVVFPLRHPEYVICDTEYDALVYKIMAGNPVRRTLAKAYRKIFNR